jgi:hypothetical protein
MAWRIEPIRQPPTKTLDAWSVYEVPFDGVTAPWTRHLVGFRLEGCRGQVSSPVVAFDPVTRRALTRSGQAYELRVGPGFHTDAFVVWSTWVYTNRMQDALDVTDEVETFLRSYEQ